MTVAIPRSAECGEINILEGIKRRVEHQHSSNKKPFNKEEFHGILGKLNGLGRGDHYQQYLDGEVEVYSLAEMFARRVAGIHNKNVIFILFGDLGGGKSMTLLDLALSCSMWLAKLKGGTPGDYFTFKNVAVIDPEMLQERLANLTQYQIIILDDAGPGYDARTFMSKQNRDLNYILQTCRTTNNIILVSAPHGAMLDVTIHRVAQYYGEISEIRHDRGITFLKVFRIVRVFRAGKILYVNMSKSGVVNRRYYSKLPPPEMKTTYDRVRDAQAKAIQRRRQEREEAEAAGKNHDAMRYKPSEETIVKLLRKVEDDPFVSRRDLQALAGCGEHTLGAVLIAAGLERVKEGKKQKWVVKEG